MKKLVSTLLALTMMVGMLAGCQSAPAESASSEAAITEAPSAATEPAQPSEEVPVVPVEAKVMKIAGTMSQADTDGEYQGTMEFARLVEEYTNGSIKCEIYPSSQLGSFNEFTEGVMLGTIEACVCGASAMGVNDPFLYVLEMPNLFKDLQHCRNFWETDNLAKDKIDGSLAALNMVSVGTLYRSPRVWCNNLRPVITPADNTGMKMRCPGSPISQSLAAAFGASPVSVAWAEVYTALSTGAVDGVENAITELYNNNMQEVLKYCSETNHQVNTQSILICKQWFDALTADEQAAIMKAGKEATEWRAEQLQGEVDNAWAKFAEVGVEITKNAEVDIAAFSAVGQSVVDEYIAKGYFTQLYVDLIKGLAD